MRGNAEQELHSALMRSEQWHRIPRFASFARGLYAYHLHGGFHRSVLHHMERVLSACVVAGVATVATLLVDWSEVSRCSVQQRCAAFRAHAPSVLSGTYLAVAWLYVAFRVRRACLGLQTLVEVREFIAVVFKLRDDEARHLRWKTLIELLVGANATHSLCTFPLDSQSANRVIMRETNYAVALVIGGVVPEETVTNFGLSFAHFSFWVALFRDESSMDPALVADPSALERRVRRFAWAALLLSPFTCAFTLTHQLVRFAGALHARSLLPLLQRRFTPGANLAMRGFDELPHARNARTAAVGRLAGRYVAGHPLPVARAAGGVVSAVSAGAVAVLLAFWSVNEESLLAAHFLGYNLLWWGTVCSASIALAPAPATRVSTRETELLVSELRRLLPAEPAAEVLRRVHLFYRSEGAIAAREVAACVLCPLSVLLNTAPRVADVVSFMVKITARLPYIGDVVGIEEEASASTRSASSERIRDRMADSFLRFREEHDCESMGKNTFDNILDGISELLLEEEEARPYGASRVREGEEDEANEDL